MQQFKFEKKVDDSQSGKRLDQVLAILIPEHSRSRLQRWIKSGQITVNNEIVKQRSLVHAGDHIKILADYEKVATDLPQELPLNIIYKDDAIILINKPAGLVVHPGAGNPNNTLVNALLHHDANLEQVARAGIVHRLDKDTTGIMLVARNPQVHTNLVEQLQCREIKRDYQAIVCGQITAGSTIETNIGRHPTKRTKMAVVENGKIAITRYRLIKRFDHYTHVKVSLETGRTHQIRVHMAHINHALIGDSVYGKNRSLQKGLNDQTKETILNFNRQALHAYSLRFTHPVTAQECQFDAPLPDDFQHLINHLAKHDCH